MNKAYIFTEGSSKIGFGHVTRCLSLYQALEEKLFDVEMIIYGDDTISFVLTNIKFRVFNWINENDLRKHFIQDADLVIIDSTIAPLSVFNNLSQSTNIFAFIDDSRRIECNIPNAVIIDWTPFVENSYKNVQTKYCSYLLGSKFISLRKSFWDVPEKVINENISEILITMGGADIRNISPKIVQLLINRYKPEVKKKVVIGRGFSEKTVSSLNNFLDKNVELLYFPEENEMINAFLNADICISAGGQTLYELARVGLPTIAIEIIDNQRFDIEGWVNAGFIEYAGNWADYSTYENIIKSLNYLTESTIRQSIKKNGSMNVDGQGARRIIRYLLNRIECK